MNETEQSTTGLGTPYLCSLTEAAYLLGISTRQVRYMVQRGELPVRRIGRRTLIPRAALREFALSD